MLPLLRDYLASETHGSGAGVGPQDSNACQKVVRDGGGIGGAFGGRRGGGERGGCEEIVLAGEHTHESK